MIYTIGGMKHSLTKTKVAVNLTLFQKNTKKRKVALIDVEPSDYTLKYINDLNLTVDVFTSLSHLPNLSNHYEDIVIISGNADNQQRSLEVADTLIVPFKDKDLGLWIMWSLTKFEECVKKALVHNPKLKSYSFLTTDDDRKDLDQKLVRALKKSPFLTYLESPLMNKMFNAPIRNNFTKFNSEMVDSLGSFTPE